ncbi:DUF5309 domain-containing protein [Methylobacter sp.]|uniref:DUF5309 domain-containing protein n=1 Tax=Methylobacter sp. TaxID=2051955 RepID=UPI003DA55832
MALQAADHTYNTIGTREDLSDLIANIAPTDCPFTKMLRKDKADATYTEWQMDSLAAPASNAQLEGDVAPSAVFSATTRVGGYTQIFAKTASVSGTVQATNKAGRGKDELAYQLTKKTKELKRDIEWALINNDVQNAGNATTARQTRGLAGWIDSNYDIGAGATMPAYSTNTARTAAGNRALTESLLKNVIQQVYAAGGDPDVIMTNPKQRQVISGFSSSNTRFQDVADKTLVSTISIYESDFGTLKIVANRFQDLTSGSTTYTANQGTVYVMETGRLASAYLRNFQTKDLAVTGDYEAKEILAELALKVDANSAHGSIRDLTQ